jgi:hypothetical protein
MMSRNVPGSTFNVSATAIVSASPAVSASV